MIWTVIGTSQYGGLVADAVEAEDRDAAVRAFAEMRTKECDDTDTEIIALIEGDQIVHAPQDNGAGIYVDTIVGSKEEDED